MFWHLAVRAETFIGGDDFSKIMAAADLDNMNESAEVVGVRTNVTTGISTDNPLEISASGNKGQFLEGLDEEAKARDFHTSQFLSAMSSVPTGAVSEVSSDLGTEESQQGLSAVRNAEMVADAAAAELTSDGSTIEYRAKLKSQIMHGAREQITQSAFRPSQKKEREAENSESLSEQENQGIADGIQAGQGISDAERESLGFADEVGVGIPIAVEQEEQEELILAEPSPLENPLATEFNDTERLAAPGADASLSDMREGLLADLHGDGPEFSWRGTDHFVDVDTEEFFAALEEQFESELLVSDGFSR